MGNNVHIGLVWRRGDLAAWTMCIAMVLDDMMLHMYTKIPKAMYEKGNILTSKRVHIS